MLRTTLSAILVTQDFGESRYNYLFARKAKHGAKIHCIQFKKKRKAKRMKEQKRAK